MSLALMVQGTTSDAGKTVMVAGLCRLLMRRGINVAPFKPQNMALNSAVTPEGGEIGRAQALQAQACGIPPHVDMNPVLLKPSSDTGAQVILQGKALSQMEAAGFHDYKKVAMNTVLDSWRNLTSRHDAVIVEGAGSPAEINLRENDIANMGFAEAVDCPVVIVADIDRGGVFAHLTGTLDLLSESEQQRVCGFIINRFRGDIALLQPGLDWLEERTGKPVLGVIPYLENLKLDSEDTVATQQTLASQNAVLNVVVPVLSRISNTTDFDALRAHPQVNLQMVSPKEPIPPADLIILPGSKNVRADLAMLKANGWQQTLETHLRYGGKVLGLCGGYQMLGETIDDPQGVEDSAGLETGFSLLDFSTTLTQGKKLRNRTGILMLGENAKCQGYEIHCGISSGKDLERPLIDYGNRNKEGALSEDNNIAGTYLHGIFDEPAAADLLLAWAGLVEGESVDLDLQRETELERLADCLAMHLSDDFLQYLMQPQTPDTKKESVGKRFGTV